MVEYVSAREFLRRKSIAGVGIRKDISAQPEDVGDRTLRFTISTGDVDKELDQIDQAGWMLDDYLSNPVVLFNHQIEKMPIGRCTDIGVQGGVLKGTVQFVPADVPCIGQHAEAVFQLCKSGFMHATSVGFIPIEYDVADRGTRGLPGLNVSKALLHEWSIVTVPCNPYALIEPVVQDVIAKDTKERRARAMKFYSLLK